MAIRVMVVDDSAVVRQVLTLILNETPDIQVYASAADPLFAERYMAKEWPDVIILDMEMPRMDGLTFLRKIMTERPTPIVICSSLAEEGAELTLQALAAGAVDVVTKPKVSVKGFLLDAKDQLCQAVRIAAKANTQKYRGRERVRELPASSEVSDLVSIARTTDSLVAIGTSTGGTQALEYILPKLSRTCPGIVVVQHMPEKFTAAFAKRLNSLCDIDVKEAESGDRILPGHAYIAPGGSHLEIQRSGAQFVTRVFKGPAVNRHCPSVDVLLRSVAKFAGRNAMGIVLTGMGDDGARGLLEMRNAGAMTIAQDEASSIVFGMPKEAIKHGGAQKILSLQDIPGQIRN